MSEEKIRVYGKAQNRIALGIVNAYLVINPQSTIAELKTAFPDSLNPDSGVRVNFISEEELKAREGGAWNGFFSKDEELLELGDASKAALVSMWTKPSFERLVDKAKDYGIVTAELDAVEKGFGKKGGYRLEYLNGFDPSGQKVKKGGCLGMLLILLLPVSLMCYLLGLIII